MKSFSRVLSIAALGALSLNAQVETARITGTVRDSSGAVIPTTLVTFTNLETNVSSQARTSDTGRYESFPLRIGSYRVTAEQEGFKRASREGVVLQIQQTAVLDFVLEIGALSAEVTVADAPPADAQRGHPGAGDRQP